MALPKTELNHEPLPFPVADEQREQVLEGLLRGDDDRPWQIGDKGAAFWAVRKIATARAAMAENQRIRDAEVARIDRWLEQENEPLRRTIAFFEAHLEAYHRQLLAQDPKAKTVRTPYGSLQLRSQQPEMIYDEERLLGWLKANRPDLIRTREEPNKADLKKAVDLQREATGSLRVVLKETGEIVDGVRAAERAPAFSVKTDGEASLA